MSATAVDRLSLWRTFDERATREEEPYVRAALAQFALEAAQIDAILSRLSDRDPFVVTAVDRILRDYAPGATYHTQWLARYTTLITQTVEVGGAELAARVGFRFDLQNPRVLNVIRRKAWAGASNITETTKANIKLAVESGRNEGLGVREIAKRIQDTTFGEITKTRAITIARTETVGALNAGEHESAMQSGVMRSKSWMHQLVGKDSRANHKSYDGLTIDIGAAFPNGLQYPHAPGAPAKEVVNCRCTALYSDEEAPA